MKFIAALSALLVGVATAKDVQSKAFDLVLTSDAKKYDGKKLAACHTGAAIESLCVIDGGSSGKYEKYYLNTTKGSQSPLKNFTPSGELVWNLPFTGNDGPSYESEPMSLFFEPATNVAMALFEPSETSTYVSFDKNDHMAIISYYDDTVTPPSDSKAKALKHWYMCETNFSGYQYETLNFVLGDAEPQNPSCKKVSVQRKFV